MPDDPKTVLDDLKKSVNPMPVLSENSDIDKKLAELRALYDNSRQIAEDIKNKVESFLAQNQTAQIKQPLEPTVDAGQQLAKAEEDLKDAYAHTNE